MTAWASIAKAVSLGRGGAVLWVLVAAASAQQAESTDAAPTADDPASFEARFAEGRLDDVVDEAYRRLAVDPGDEEASYWLGSALLERARPMLDDGDFGRDLGRALLERAIEAFAQVDGERRVAAAEGRAYARWLHGPDDGLAGDLERWFAEDGHGYAAYVRGLVAEHPAERAEWFDRARAAEPLRTDFSLAAASAHAATGARELALDAWRAAAASAADPFAALAVLTEIFPRSAFAQERLAEITRWRAERPALERDPWLCWHEAQALRELGRAEDAVAAMERAEEPWPDGFERALADLARTAGRDRAAAERLEKLGREGDLEAVERLSDLADSAALERRWTDALAFYDACLRVAPRHVRARVNRALTLSRAGRGEAARAAYAEVLQTHPGRADLLNDAALHEAGAGDLTAARELWERAIELPLSDDARENLAASLVLSDPGRARRLLDEVLAREPGRDRSLWLHLVASGDGSR